MSNEVGDLVASVEKARYSVLESVADLSEAQGAFKPSANEWSIAEVLEHLCRDRWMPDRGSISCDFIWNVIWAKSNVFGRT